MSIIKWLAKKYVISALNDLLGKYKCDVANVTSTITLWIDRLQLIIDQLKTINLRVSDGQIDNKEVDDSVKEIEELIKKF